MVRLAMTGANFAFARRLLLGGATLLPAGIAVAAVFAPDLGSVMTLTALAILIAGLHLFGRAGPDPGA
jgi:hypothetical protein